MGLICAEQRRGIPVKAIAPADQTLKAGRRWGSTTTVWPGKSSSVAVIVHDEVRTGEYGAPGQVNRQGAARRPGRDVDDERGTVRGDGRWCERRVHAEGDGRGGAESTAGNRDGSTETLTQHRYDADLGRGARQHPRYERQIKAIARPTARQARISRYRYVVRPELKIRRQPQLYGSVAPV